jgi:thymidylate synthase ThyX
MSMRVTDQFEVELVSTVGSDLFICETANFSPPVEDNLDKIIASFMDIHDDHLFKLCYMTFKIHAPIFVLKEFHRFNHHEQPDRHLEYEPVFYMPPMTRGIVQVGESDTLVTGDTPSYQSMFNAFVGVYELSWTAYKLMLEGNVAKEVASMCLPTSIYSNIYVTMNLRRIMDLLSIQKKVDEVHDVCSKIEDHFKKHFPVTHSVFSKGDNYARGR